MANAYTNSYRNRYSWSKALINRHFSINIQATHQTGFLTHTRKAYHLQLASIFEKHLVFPIFAGV